MQLAKYEIEDEELLTRTHVVNASSAKFLTKPLSGGQPKVGDSDTKSIIKTHDILRLQITMINTEAVTVLNCAKQLQEHMFDEVVIP